ncbi:GroES-like protein [Aspergillus sclerotioniger CBS 115572]|uniref:GroES-like protein n=1 Tax=Aspergillus sclerotioniger CBS 115572 TaxID=1450535 RepID=A0A317WQG4_9EURO|nr:GroES-like protein [Aspergillus sclerotioniger CBS 115572]PWY88646.1 GroES-like protein [Aspergillus sclerotioniger CBS 115572]
MTQNKAAWIPDPTAHPFRIQDAPYPIPGPGEIVIKNAAVSINPADWKIQTYGAPWLGKWPFILGTDVAGVVVNVGPGVTRFTNGQRVVAYCHCLGTGNPANSGFQLYTLVKDTTVAGIPDSITFEQAAVLPQAISTAAAGLFLKESLDLPIPSASAGVVKPTGKKSILIWGGASSVGATAIQFADAVGLTVITTASAHNHELVKSLGASAVFDYKSSTVVEDLASALTDTDLVGVFDAISEPSSFELVRAILDQLNVDVRTICVSPYDKPTERFAPIFISSNFLTCDSNKYVADGIWRDFVSEALENKRLKPKPDPEVVGKALEDIQDGVDVLKKGVSAKKLVVTL